MLFNSIEFAVFLPAVFVLYWLLQSKLKLQNSLIVAASFFFYGWWDVRFLLLMIGSASVDFLVGVLQRNQENEAKRKALMISSLVVNLGILGFFKYFDFFVDGFENGFTLLWQKGSPETLRVILPVGISFYTFQALSYSIDVYQRKLQPVRSIIDYFAFISFFPQLVAGPIERATHLLPQFLKPRQFDYTIAVDGMRQILWGLVKKVVVADCCATCANEIFKDFENGSGIILLLGLIFFAFQIYGDFSGYSDIAQGTAKLFGFSLMTNFAFPYFSRNIKEFWQRWHISLSTWFRDYVYIPLGGNRGGKVSQMRNILITFTLSGFWHGANLTYIFWGFLNGLYYFPSLLFKNALRMEKIVAWDRRFPAVKELGQMVLTFILVLFAWVFFRSTSMGNAITYISGIFSPSLFSFPEKYAEYLIYIVALVAVEWMQRRKKHCMQIEGLPRAVRHVIYIVLGLIILLHFPFDGTPSPFIYFQF